MFAVNKTSSVPHADPFRWLARASAVVLFLCWLTLFIGDAMRPSLNMFTTSTVGQAVALAVVFAGYAIGVRHELFGGIATIVGTLTFFAIVFATTDIMPGIAAMLFIVPGVLYLLAWHYDGRKTVGQ